jgi:crotonobetainyl-CoA:carnitine CoA-transferase CaiB-like acyl-CoA transferase
MTEDERPAAFAGIRALDLTTTMAGAVASMHLADFGADVLRVEADEGDRLTPAYIFANRNKQLIDCDVRSVDGRRQAQSLIQRADVLFIDGSAERLDDLSCDAESLCGADPRLVHVWMPPHATRGAVSALPPDELLLAAWTGMADQQPGSAQQPVAPVVPILGYAHGALAASAAAAALLSREARGSGGAVTVSGLHAVSALNVAIMVDLPGMIRPFSGPKKAAWGPANFRMYRCRDGTWLFLAALTAPFFIMALNALELMDVMLLPGIDGEFTNIRKPEMNEMVSSKIAERMIERDRSEWQEVFDGARVPNGPIQVREEWAVSDTVAAEEMLVSMPHHFVGEVGLPDVSIRLGRTPSRVAWLPDSSAVVDWSEAWSQTTPELDAIPDVSVPVLPLEGIRVLDVSSYLSGPFASTLLQNFGASVDKVEAPAGDPFRLGIATYSALNRDKTLVTLDLKTSAGLEEFYGMVRSSDVVIENMRYGVAEELGIDHDSLALINRAIISGSIGAWGVGPLRDTPGFDPLVQARSGLMAAQGGNGDPVIQAVAVHDIGSGALLALGVIAALFARTHIGEGQSVKVSLARTSLAFQGAEFTKFSGSPAPVVGAPDFLGESAWHRLYRCSDGWIAVLSSRDQLESFVHIAEESDEDLGAACERLLGRLSTEEAMARVTLSGASAVAVLGREDVFAAPNLIENDFFFRVEDAKVGPLLAVRAFADWKGVPRAEVGFTPGAN